MREVPECLSRRYNVLNELIEDICTALPVSTGGKVPELSYMDFGPEEPDTPPVLAPRIPAATEPPAPEPPPKKNDVGIKLMCDFWKILEDDPDCDLKEEVQQRLCRDTCKGRCKKQKVAEKRPPSCCAAASYAGRGEDESLRKALVDVRTAASYEQKCNERVGELEIIQKDLMRQIRNLEHKTNQEGGLLKEAECIWTCMETSYKNKLADTKETVELMESQLKEIEASLNKWKKNHNEVESELKSVHQSVQDTNLKIIQKENDIKIMQIEIEGLNKRIGSNEKDLATAKLSYKGKKDASDAKVLKIAKEFESFQKQHLEDCKRNAEKEKQAQASVKDVREDLQNLCRVLLQKKIANEDLKAESEALVNEVELLKKACITCRNRCNRRERNLMDECKRLDKEIAKYNLQCIRCHKETSSADMTGFCFECPRCLEARECLNEGDHCVADPAQDCVCTRIKRKFLDNVFDNMYSVLDSQVCTCPGKEVADCILIGLKRSTNGKLNNETRLVVQDFILSTVRQNLNLTIVGGAVKTRCEMDPETYQQLMLCLKDVTVTEPVKEDKATVVKKTPCTRWKHSIECNCPLGPKICPCTKTAQRKTPTPSSCGPPPSEVNVEEEKQDPCVRFCPLPDPVECGSEGGKDLPSAKPWSRPPCVGGTCNFSSKMRAAQCVLGPEALADVRSRPSADARISTSNVQISPSGHTYPPDKRKYSGNVTPYQGDEPSRSTEEAVYFVSNPVYSNKLTYSAKTPMYSANKPGYSANKPAYSANKPAYSASKPVYPVDNSPYPVDEKTYPANEPMFPVDEPAYPVVEPAYLADEPAYPSEERVYRPGRRAYPANEPVYPVDKPVHPAEERLYRPDGRTYPADEPVYLADEPAYLAGERVYRSDGRTYPAYEPVYPADEPAYPAEERVHRSDRCAYPAYEPVYPGDEPAYPAEERAYRRNRRASPTYEPVYLADEPAYPAEERPYRRDRRAYPAYEPVYQADEPAYPADECAYRSYGRKQRANGRMLDESAPESSAYTPDERAHKASRHPQKSDRHSQKVDRRAYSVDEPAYPVEERAYRPEDRTQKVEGLSQKAYRRTLDESAPESREYTADERAQKTNRHPQKPDGREYPADERV